MDSPYGLLRIEEPIDRAETTTGFISVTSELFLGVSDAAPVPVTFDLTWSNAALVTDLFGRFDIDGVAYDIRLYRTSDWDGAQNVWSGEMPKSDEFLSVPITVF